MKRLAIFVEGATELSFITTLVLQIGGARLTVEAQEISGGSHAPRIVGTRFKPASGNTGATHYVLVVDCGSEDTVATRIVDEHKNLIEKGFTGIIGMRDVRPNFTRDEVPKLEARLKATVEGAINQSHITVTFVLSVMEIEAWFLAEWRHFEQIDPAITLDAIRGSLHFDPSNEDMSLRDSPAQDLDDCYKIAGKRYQKKKYQSPTVSALHMDHVYLELRSRIPNLHRLLSSIDQFLN